MISVADERSSSEEGAAGGAPLDAFRLTPEPPRVMRLSRKALAAIGGAAGLAIGGALLWALRAPVPQPSENLYDAAGHNRSEAVRGAPKDYGAIPKLGPALPGDLGRPIVSAQQDGAAISVPPMGAAAPAADPARAAREQARQQERQERDAARSSRLFGAAGPESSALPADVPEPQGEMPARRPADGRSGFLETRIVPAESSERVVRASSPYVVQAGSIIPAALITAIHSDLPGQVVAQVTQPVYDSPTGRHLLIPQGARLIGEYDNDVAPGHGRVLLAWDRLILPGGRSIRLDRQPGADASGMSGLADRTDNHWGRMLRAGLVSALLGAGAELGGSGNDEIVRAIRDGAQDTAGQTGRRLVERDIAIPPTIRIRPGFALRVIVTRDLILEPMGEK